jgi:hypothetical protein
MKISRIELGLVALVIVYVAFFTHPPPAHLTNLLETPVGHAIALLGVLYVTVYQSFIVGIFLGIAYIMTARNVTEYMDEKEQTPEPKKEEKKQPTASGIPPPAVTGAMQSMMKKGDVRLPQAQGKSTTTKPSTTTMPKPASPPPTTKSGVENFASF